MTLVSFEFENRRSYGMVIRHIVKNVESMRSLVRWCLLFIVADNDAHALQLANDTELGLSSAVFASDMDRGFNVARGVVAGMTYINDVTVDDQPNAPFGGEKIPV